MRCRVCGHPIKPAPGFAKSRWIHTNNFFCCTMPCYRDKETGELTIAQPGRDPNWDAEYRGITEEEWNKLVDNPIGQRFTPELRDIWDRMMAESTKVCCCGHKKMDHSEDEGVEHYCSYYTCSCREFVEHKED